LIDTEEGQASVGLMADTEVGPELAAEQADMMSRIERIILEELTEKQRTAMLASQVHGMHLDVVAQRMDMNRNALYKLLHDARIRLKKRMIEEGLAPEDVLAAFESG
jgi:RNA polymerase sigma-70 factor (ECF subfamily)